MYVRNEKCSKLADEGIARRSKSAKYAMQATSPPVQRSACDQCRKSKKGPTYCAKMRHQRGAASVTSITVHACISDAHTWAEWYELTADGERHEVDAMRVQVLQAVADDNDFRLVRGVIPFR